MQQRVAPAGVILAIEDDPATAALLRELLEDEGYAVTVLSSPCDVRAAVRGQRPCAIVLDLALPYRSGGAVLAALKADPSTACVPVLVVSARAEELPPDRRKLAAAVIAKPFDIDTLLDAIQAAATGLG